MVLMAELSVTGYLTGSHGVDQTIRVGAAVLGSDMSNSGSITFACSLEVVTSSCAVRARV